MSRFSSITAGLLARKGDAQPSTMPDAFGLHRPFVSGEGETMLRSFERFEPEQRLPPTDVRAAERSAFIRFHPEPERDLRRGHTEDAATGTVAIGTVAEPKQVTKMRETKEPVSIDKPRRLFVNLSPSDYQRLGIIAVKRDTTRHRLLREALDDLLKRASAEYCKDCTCLSGEACCGACE